MSDEPSESSPTVSQHMPFLLVMSVYFFSGSVFLTFNVPVLYHLANAKSFPNLGELVRLGLFEFWISVFKGASDPVILGVPLFLGLVLGLLLSPVEKLFTLLFVRAAQLISHALPKSLQSKIALLFTAKRFADKEYPAFLAWLIANRPAKLQWEWELFLYQLHWSICTNVLIFIGASASLLWAKATPASIILVGGAVMAYTILFGLARSFAMGMAHEYFFAQFATPERTFPGKPGLTAQTER